MSIQMYILIGIVWLALGIHSAYFLVKRVTLYSDFRYSQIWMLVVCVLVPIISHISTMVTFPSKTNKVLFKQKNVDDDKY